MFRWWALVDTITSDFPRRHRISCPNVNEFLLSIESFVRLKTWQFLVPLSSWSRGAISRMSRTASTCNPIYRRVRRTQTVRLPAIANHYVRSQRKRERFFIPRSISNFVDCHTVYEFLYFYLSPYLLCSLSLALSIFPALHSKFLSSSVFWQN